MLFRFTLMCFICLWFTQLSAQTEIMTHDTMSVEDSIAYIIEGYNFRNKLLRSCRKNDKVLMDSLFEVGKNDTTWITFRERIFLSLYLGKFDELSQWLSVSKPPTFVSDEDESISYFFYALTKGKKRKTALLKSMEEKVYAHIEQEEIIEFLSIFIRYHSIQLGEKRAEYNRDVVEYCYLFPNSPFSSYMAHVLNLEIRPSSKSFGGESIIGVGVVQDINPGGITWNGWEPRIFRSRFYRGYGPNYYSISLLGAFFEKVPRFIGNEGPFREYNYSRVCFRYDRKLLFGTRRFDMYAFIDYGIANADLEWDYEIELPRRYIEFGTASGGLKFNWNFGFKQDVMGIDTPFDITHSYLGIELGYIHNFYNFTPDYRNMYLASVSFGMHINEVEPKRNSALRGN